VAAHRSLLENVAPGRALDVACGRGRNAFFLAALGFEVVAVDVSDVAVDIVRARAASSAAAAVTAVRADLEVHPLPRPPGYDVIVVVAYLQRSLFAPLAAALAPRGLLVYETFTREHPRINPAHALAPGELRSAFPTLAVVDEHEADGRAGLVARRP
jgi:tellurite methyltransferase